MDIIILRGTSGSGKSTLTRDHKGVVVSADHYFTVDGVYKFDIARIGDAHAHCLRRFTDFVTGNASYVPEGPLFVDNTNCSIAEVAPYIALATAYGHSVRVIDFEVAPEVAAARNAHGVPLSAVCMQYMAMRKANAEWPVYWPVREKAGLDNT